jgi:hypothetical protein
VLVYLIPSLMPKKISNWAMNFSLANMQISGMPINALIIPVLIMVFESPPSVSIFIPIFLGSLIFLAGSLIPFFSQDGQEYAIRVYNRFGIAAPTLFAAMVALYALILFSWVGLFLSVHGWVSISGTDGIKKGSLGFYIVAFGYEAAKAIPIVDLSDVFQWKAPYNHSGFTSGILILMFRIAVLAPIIAFYGVYWRHVRERRKERPIQEAMITDRPVPSNPSESSVDRSGQHPET